MRTKAIIHLDRFIENIGAVRTRIGNGRRICVPVKADGYGHGALQIAQAAIEAGAYCLGVAAVTEGIELRNAGIRVPVLLFSPPHPGEIQAVIDAELTPFVSDAWFASALNEKTEAAGIRLPVHLKVDTGMGRIGCRAEEASGLAQHIADCAGLELAGVATHLAVSDSTDAQDIAYTRRQLALFKEAVDAIAGAGIDPGVVHAANSGGVILHPDSWLDMVRPGILLYGYKAAGESGIADFPYEPIIARPVMELRSVVVSIKKVRKGESVSYGRTWTAREDTSIAVLPTGYADGLPRLASGKWRVVIGGGVYPLAGRICMDQCCVDLRPDSGVRRWDEAVIFGGAAQDAAELAETVGTIPYEITCNINKRVPRIYERQ
ncbi:MAG: alanine racemase [Treponema sp.]|jgi:alanine racemase|nr:alanine racemase [Treponema sp.]